MFYNTSASEFTYTVNGESVSITGYTGTKPYVHVPACIEGIPVTSVKLNGNTTITYVVIPETVTALPSNAFYGCTALENVSLPETLTSIGSYAFYNCSGLTAIEIPEGVTSIGSHAFYSCNPLATIRLPDNVGSIGTNAFANCPSTLQVLCKAGTLTAETLIAIGKTPVYIS